VRAIAYFKYVSGEQTIGITMLYLETSRGVKREDKYLFINKVPDVSEGVEILNEVSDYIYDVIGVRITAFTIDNDNAMYLDIKGHEYPFREYKRVMTITKMENVWVQGYYKRFALFRDCKQCIEYANRIAELKRRIDELYNEFLRLYYTLDSEDLENVIGSPLYRKMKELRYEVHKLINSNIIVNTGMYIGKRLPIQVLRAYERMAEKLNEMIAKAKELYTLRSLTS
jgi:hypothetical protein